MKIGLNQPNGFSTHFAKDSSKYLDNNSESKSKASFYIQIFNTERINSILMSIMVVQLLQLLVKILLLLAVIQDFLRDTVLSLETNQSLFK